MLLRASGEENGIQVDLEVVVDPTRSGDPGVPNGTALLAFASAATRASPSLDQARADLVVEVGESGMVEAAATVAIFNGLVRVADGTGIQLDPTMMTATANDRDRLGIDTYSGADNSLKAATRPRRQATGVDGMFA